MQSSTLGPGIPYLEDFEDDGLDDPAEAWDQDDFWAAADRAHGMDR